MTNARIVITVASDGVVGAETQRVTGVKCLDYIALLEELLDARTVDSAYTADYTRTHLAEQTPQEERNVERA